MYYATCHDPRLSTGFWAYFFRPILYISGPQYKDVCRWPFLAFVSSGLNEEGTGIRRIRTVQGQDSVSRTADYISLF